MPSRPTCAVNLRRIALCALAGIFIMEEIVYKSSKGNVLTSSRLVALKFEKRHSDVLRSIENLQCSSGFKERNFALLISKDLHPSPLIQEKEVIMTRDGFTFLAMGFTGFEAAKFKEDFIEAFNKMESQIKGFSIPQTFSEALQLAANQAKEIEIQKTQIKELSPKAEVYDQISECTNLKQIGEVCKILGYGRTTFFDMLRNDKILMWNNIPYQKYIDSGYFEVKTKPVFNMNKNQSTTYVTPRGELWLAKIMTK